MDKEKAKENRMIQQFFKNKVFWGNESKIKDSFSKAEGRVQNAALNPNGQGCVQDENVSEISNRRKCSGQECEFVAGRSYQYERQIHTRME